MQFDTNYLLKIKADEKSINNLIPAIPNITPKDKDEQFAAYVINNADGMWAWSVYI
jgi:hypothetical protein